MIVSRPQIFALLLALFACGASRLHAQDPSQSLSAPLSGSLAAPIYDEDDPYAPGSLTQLPGGGALTMPNVRTDLLDPLFTSIYSGPMTPYFESGVDRSVLLFDPTVIPETDTSLLKTADQLRGAGQGNWQAIGSRFDALRQGTSGGAGQGRFQREAGEQYRRLQTQASAVSRASFTAGASSMAAFGGYSLDSGIPMGSPLAPGSLAAPLVTQDPSAPQQSPQSSPQQEVSGADQAAPETYPSTLVGTAGASTSFAGSSEGVLPVTGGATAGIDISGVASSIFPPAFPDLPLPAPTIMMPVPQYTATGRLKDENRGADPLALTGTGSVTLSFLVTQPPSALLNGEQTTLGLGPFLQPRPTAGLAIFPGAGGNGSAPGRGMAANAAPMPSIGELRRIYRRQMLFSNAPANTPMPSDTELRRLYQELLRRSQGRHSLGGLTDTSQ